MKNNKNFLKNEIKNLKIIISMKCLDCACYQTQEIILCQINTCPLFKERPKIKKGLYKLIKELREKNKRFYG